jgi:hypothetical protein
MEGEMAETRYLDFDLSISREGDRYLAEVRSSPVGPSDRVVLRWPFGTEPHEVLLLKLENAILKGRGYRGAAMSSEEKILREFGTEVFRAVFRTSGAVAEKFTSSLDHVRAKGDKIQGLRLKLRVDPPELAMLPWEYMFDESKADADVLSYVCLRSQSPLVRFINVEGPSTALRINGPLRILGMISNPGDNDWERLDTEAERHRITEALKDIPKSAVSLEWVRGGSQDDLLDLMQQGYWHIFHFIGHGGTERYIDGEGQSRERGFVVMQNGQGGGIKVSASELGLMLEGRGKPPRLAVLNCCDSGRGSSGVSSVGAALVKAGVPIAVAMQFAISNGAAARFAGRFYKSLVSGDPVERAMTFARQHVRTESYLEWGIPVLFTRASSSVLFEIQPGETRTDAGVTPVVPADPAATRRTQARDELRRLFQ